MLSRRTFIQSTSAVSFSGAAFALSGCGRREGGRLKIKARQGEHYSLYGDWMEQGITLDIYDPQPERARSVLVRARGLLEEIEGIFSLSNASSQVMELNRQRALASPSDFLSTLNAFAREIGIATGGAFNMAATPLALGLAKGESRSPEFIADALASAQGHAFIGPDNVMEFTLPGTIIGFEPSLPGFAADLLHAQLQGAEVKSARLDIGAQRVIGIGPEGTPFTLATSAGDEPFIDGGVASVTPLIKGATPQNLDPRSGLVPALYARVDVIADSALTAQCLACAFTLMPQDEIRKRMGAARSFGLTKRCEVILTPFQGEPVRL